MSQGCTSTIVFNANGGRVYVKLHSQLEQLIDEDEKVMLCTLNDITSEVNFREELKNAIWFGLLPNYIFRLN